MNPSCGDERNALALERVVSAIDAADRAVRAVPRGHRARPDVQDAVIALHDARRHLEVAPG